MLWCRYALNFFFFRFVFLLCLNYWVISSVTLGVIMLGLSVSLAFLIKIISCCWYRIIMVMIFISGILVLYFYMLTVDYKPSFQTLKMKVFLVRLLRSLWLLTLSTGFKTKKKLTYCTNYRDLLLRWMEFSIIITITVYLLLILWVIKKIILKKFTNLRPLF